MFSMWSDGLCRGLAAGAMAIVLAGTILPGPCRAAPAGPESCPLSAAGQCDYMAGQEGTHRIDLTLPPTAARPKSIRIAGQECPLHPHAGGGNALSCFAYLAGGTNYALSVPPAAQVSIVRAEPTRGEPVTLIP